MRRDRENALFQQIGERLAEVGLEWDLDQEFELEDGRKRPDALVTIRHPGGELRGLAEAKIGLRRQDVGAVIAQLERIGQQYPDDLAPLVLADYVNPELAEYLREEGVLFLDAAGNAFLRDEGLYVWATGKRDVNRLERQRQRRRAFQPSGLKVVFTLLCDPKIVEEDYRTIAEAADVALGTVQWVMRDLVEEGFVLKLGRFERRLVEPAELLDAWTPAYARDLRPRLLLGRFEPADPDWWRKVELGRYGAYWGGEVAAAIWTKHLKPQQHTVYADRIPGKLIAQQGLTKNEDGRIEIREKFWGFAHDDATTPPPQQPVVPPVLAYADLLALGEGRTREVAHRLREELIDGPFETHLARWDR